MNNETATINPTNIKSSDTNASPSAYGWCFQVGAGISLMLDNVKEFTSLKIEGASDDIEITLDSGKIYAQAKSVTQMGDQRSASTNLNNALRLLSQDANNGDAVKLIYITNIANPLSSPIASAFQYGNSYEFSILPDEAQTKIREKVSDEFPTEKFQLHILSFFGEGDNKFQSIKAKISEFLREAINDPSYNKQLLNHWFETFMVNASDKPDNQKNIELKKKDVIYPVIVLVIDSPVGESDFAKVCDHDNYTEISQEFREMINRKVCDYEFFSEVIGDYLSKRILVTDKTNYKYDYVRNEWKVYDSHFSAITNAETREALIKLLILTVITQRSNINRIKEATNL
jgi:hypothetical protein